MYLTRDEAVAELVKDGSKEEGARRLLDSPLAAWPGSHRTNFYLITRYEAGTIPGVEEPRWTISPW